jgi:serine/threonine-protein kinase
VGQKSKLKPGDLINGTYEVERLLGAGYSGEVWAVRQRFLGASFALKLMHAEDLDNDHKTSRFSAEASTLFGLQHENVVRVVDANRTPEGLSFTVMELLRGETLAQRLTRGRLHPLRALKYAYDVACGLDAAHELGVVHRDVKPDNIFITTEDVAKLLDFTAAKFSTLDLRTTQPPDRVGTLAFMSPEHIDGMTSDPRIDQYALGHVTWNMFVGRHGFERYFAAQYKLMKAQFEEMPPSLVDAAGLPAWLDDLLGPSLAKDIDERYATMAELARAIRGGMRRLTEEIADGRLVVGVPLGEPPIDLDEAPASRSVRRVYVAPVDLVRPTTGPVLPSQRVTLAPAAPESGARADAVATVPVASLPRQPFVPTLTTAPMPAPLPPITAPVQPMTTSLQPQPRSRVWFAPLVLALAMPVAGALAWREKTRPSAPSLPAQAAPVVLPVGPASPSAIETAAPAPAPPAPTAEAASSSAPSRSAPSAPPAPPKPSAPATRHRTPRAEEAPAAVAPIVAEPTAAPPAASAEAPKPAPHRLFETEQ